MTWLIGIAIVAFLYYCFVIVKGGNVQFWKVASLHPDEAYAFFKQTPCFAVFDSKPPGGYRANLPSGQWDGPFKLPVPSQGRVVTIYGLLPDYLAAQQAFVRNLHA